MLQTEEIVDRAVEALENYKAQQIVKIDLRKIENCFCSFFVICNGTSSTHITGLTDAVERGVKEGSDEKPIHKEGMSSQWVVIDYGDVVVHIFDRELRDYYQLEDLWGDGIIEEVAEK